MMPRLRRTIPAYLVRGWRTLSGPFVRGWRALLKATDLQDIYTHGGLLLIGVGCWMIYPPSAGVTVGALVFWLGLGAPGIHPPTDRTRERRGGR